MSSEHQYSLPPGFRLRQYHIVRLLGHGGFGLTYLADDTNLHRKVAIKELLPFDFAVREPNGTTVVARTQHDATNLEWARQRFVEEGRTLAALQHPSILHVFDIFELHGTAYLVTAFIEGSNFQDWLRDGRAIRQEDLLPMANSLLDALQLVHERGFLHRDIKPENILIDRETSRPVLIDFGNARMAPGKVTSNMTAVLTRGYAPFEQYQTRSRQGPFTDIYALGAVLYRAITGARPDDALDRMDQDKIQVLSEQRIPGYTQEFLATIDKALQMQRESRWQSCEEWTTALWSSRGVVPPPDPSPAPSPPSPPVPSPPVPSPSPARSRKGLAIVGLALLALCVVVLAFSNRRHSPRNMTGDVKAYDDGQGVTQDHTKTVDLFRKTNSPIPLTPAPEPAPVILPVKESDDARYFALVPGNEWTMDAAGTSKAGNAKGLSHYKMEGREERGGKTYTVRHDKVSVGPVNVDEMNYYRTDADGLHTIFGATEGLGEQLEVPFPIRPGNHWTVWNQFGLLDYTVVGFDTVTVPAGAYKNCCHLRTQGAMGVSDVWLAPGVGGVKSTIVSDGGSTLFQSLTAFKPAHP
jgi:serine/threonine protein kinase